MVEFNGIVRVKCPKCGHEFEDEATIDWEPDPDYYE